MATIGTRDPEHEQFWELAEPHLASGRLVEDTMMGQLPGVDEDTWERLLDESIDFVDGSV